MVEKTDIIIFPFLNDQNRAKGFSAQFGIQILIAVGIDRHGAMHARPILKVIGFVWESDWN